MREIIAIIILLNGCTQVDDPTATRRYALAAALFAWGALSRAEGGKDLIKKLFPSKK